MTITPILMKIEENNSILKNKEIGPTTFFFNLSRRKTLTI